VSIDPRETRLGQLDRRRLLAAEEIGGLS